MILFLLLFLGACSYDSAALDARLCAAEADCDRLGIQYSCEEGYCIAGESCASDIDCGGMGSGCLVEVCVRGACARIVAPEGAECGSGFGCVLGECDGNGECLEEFNDERCQDGLFCNGAELCVPQLAADDSGCVPGDLRVADDGILCTTGYCDEGEEVVLQDADACECDSPGQPCTHLLGVPPCFVAICTDALTCRLDPLPEGSDCDDGATCTENETCTGEQVCAGTANDGRCDDGRFCNGDEVCSPLSPDADPGGCKDGVPPQLSDGFECSVDSCNEELDRIIHDRQNCGCSGDSDCAGDCVIGQCNGGVCDLRFVNAGTQCDDRAACTSGDACDGRGHCLGTLAHDTCDDGLYCTGEETCDPESPRGNQAGCVRGTSPTEGVQSRDCEVVSCDEGAREVTIDTSDCCDPIEESPLSGNCGDGQDNDCDGFVDAADSDCDFNPIHFGGLVLWLDAAQEDSFRTDDQGLISDWYDRSGRGNHASAIGEERPRVVEVNGKTHVSFDGGQHMVVANEAQFDFGGQVTVIVVFNVEAYAEDWQALVTKGDDSWRVHRFQSSPGVAFGWTYFWGSDDIGGQTVESGQDLHQVMAVWRPHEVEFILDANARAARGFVFEHALSQNDKPVWIGNNFDHPRRRWRGDIVEVLIYGRTLADTERRAIFNYLRAKWNLP